MIWLDSSVASRPLVLSIKDHESHRRAARLVKAGYPVGAFVRSTCVIWVDAENREAVESIVTIKGAKRTGKPLSTILYGDDLVEMIDFDRIRPDLRPLFENAGELAARVGRLCLMRVPVTADAVRNLPEITVSETLDGTRWVQNWVPGKKGPGYPFVDEMLAAGIRVPSATSMNVSGQPEIADQQEALAFCEDHAIPMFLADLEAKPVAKGSFPIISVDMEGVKLVRQGQFPGYLFRYLLQTDVDTSQAAPSRYPVYETHCERCASKLGPHELHDEIEEILGK